MAKKNWGYLLNVLLAGAALTSCQTNRTLVQDNPQSVNSSIVENAADASGFAYKNPFSPDVDRKTRQSTYSGDTNYGSERFFEPDGTELTGTKQSRTKTAGETYIFRDAPIDAVVNQLLGEAFGLSYSIDPQVNGSLTLRLEGIASAEEAVSGLDAALGLQGFEVIIQSGTYIVQRKGNGGGESPPPVFLSSDDPIPSGTSSAVIQVRHANTGDIAEIARTLLRNELIRYHDDDRGLIVLSGEPDEVVSGIRLLKALDVNWLSAVSTAMVPVENTSPTELASDLEPIMSRLGGISILPMDRLQSIMIISRHRDGLDQARDWIARLDRDARPMVNRDLLIYEARYVNAEELLALTAPEAFSYSDYSTSPATDQTALASSSLQTASPVLNVQQSNQTGLFADLSIAVDQGQNAIVARGPNSELQSLRELLSSLDRPKRQVLIEATIVEVSLTDATSLGIQWDAVEDTLAATFTDTSSGDLTSLFPGVSVSYINTDVAAVVNALATTSDVEIVSSPRMMVLNNETARLQIGDQVPIVTQSAVSVTDPGAPLVNSTSYRDTGVILTVTPRIRAGGMVEIEVAQEVSGVSETTTSNIDSPTISQRSIESVLAVPDGATAVLGGLMSTTRSWSESGVPLLKDIPGIGLAFRSTNASDRRTELVILIEPTVVPIITPPSDIPTLLRNALLRARGEL